jgi:hypothetical protein
MTQEATRPVLESVLRALQPTVPWPTCQPPRRSPAKRCSGRRVAAHRQVGPGRTRRGQLRPLRLNTAILTSDLAAALMFAREAGAGRVLVNSTPSFRADHMPYGGVKDSGQGRESVKYAIAGAPRPASRRPRPMRRCDDRPVD